MKNILIGIVIGITSFIGISSSVIEQPTTVKIAKPSSIVVLTDYYTDGIVSKINKYTSLGYRVVAVTNGGDNAMVIAVVEKY